MPAERVMGSKRASVTLPKRVLFHLMILMVCFLSSGGVLLGDTLVFLKETVLRESPTAEAKEIGVAVKGSFYELLGEKEDEVGNLWYEVSYPQTTPEGEEVVVEAYCYGEGLIRSNKSIEWLQKYTVRLKDKKWTDWQAEVLEKVLQGKIEVGFTTDQVLLALGAPLRTEKGIPGIEEQWVYELSYVNFEKGLVNSQTLRQPVTLPEVEAPPEEEKKPPPPRVEPTEKKPLPPAAVRTRYGSLTLGGILQFWALGKMPPAEETDFEFIFKRARVLLWGDIGTSKIGYFLRFEGRESPFLLDAKLRFFYIPKTEIAIGRFLPDFSLYMPRLVSQLDTTNYPVVVQKYGMWHQVGIQSTTTTGFVDFTLGVFNGPENRFRDDNSEKDYLFKVNLKPVKGFQFALYRWQGSPRLSSETWKLANRDGANLQLSTRRFSIKVELIRGINEKLNPKGEVLSIEGIGGYANMVYQLHPRAELVFRYDYYDINRAFANNEIYWITPGLNLKLHQEVAVLSVNYVVKREKPTEINNDLLIVQLQISF